MMVDDNKLATDVQRQVPNEGERECKKPAGLDVTAGVQYAGRGKVCRFRHDRMVSSLLQVCLEFGNGKTS